MYVHIKKNKGNNVITYHLPSERIGSRVRAVLI